MVFIFPISVGSTKLTGPASPDTRTLSGGALDALKEFYLERDAATEKFEKLKVEANQHELLSMNAFKEDWQESQFWVRL